MAGAMSWRAAGAVLLVVLAVVQAAQATVYEVGTPLGWTIPAPGALNYFNRWAGGKTYYVGDVLQFNYNPEIHNVVKVGSIVEYHACSISGASPTYTDGATSFTLDTASEHFFICSVPGHCASGMRLAVRAINRPRA